MTKKEFNQLRAAMYSEAMKNAEIAEAVSTSGVCYIYEVEDSTGQHSMIVLSAKTQLNDNTLRAHGIAPETAKVTLKLTLTRQTKVASW